MLVPSRLRNVCNVIVDGSCSFTRSLTTADSKCQPLFILRMGRELGGFGLVGGFFCEFLTTNAYPRLTFGTIFGTGAVFLAPNPALVCRCCMLQCFCRNQTSLLTVRLDFGVETPSIHANVITLVIAFALDL